MKIINKMNSKIMKDMYDFALSSNDHTWFLETEAFNTDYNEKDYLHFLSDVDFLNSIHMKSDLSCIIEYNETLYFSDSEQAIFYGDFIKLMESEIEYITITEKLEKRLPYLEYTEAEALEIASEKYKNEIIILDYSNYIDTVIEKQIL